MDEKMHSILDDVRAAAADAGVKARELLSAGKANIRLAELNAARLTALRQVGEMVYGTHTGSPTDSDVLLAKLQEIDGICAEIAALKEARGEEPQQQTCAACGKEAKPGDRFCRECGSAL